MVPSPSSGAPRLVLIDASSFIFRAYHAIPPLTNRQGVPTNATLGFTRQVLKALKELNPTHVALAFDKESRAERQKIDPNYKANRQATPEDLAQQFPFIRRVVEGLNLPVLEVAGWEADDVIGTLSKRAKAEGFCVLVVTGDKDFVQIVDEDVHLYDPQNDRYTDPAEVKERLGIEPRQMRDYLALIGDAVDNVPKVPGIGPKTAVELLHQFGGVDALLERLSEVKKPKMREALESHRESLLRARDLVTFRTDLELGASIEDLKRRPMHEEQLRQLFTELEFSALLKELPAKEPTKLVTETQLVTTKEALQALASAVRDAGEVTLIPVYEGLPFAASLVALGVALKDGTTRYVPLGHEGLGVEQVRPADFKQTFQGVLEDAAVKKGGHGLKALWLLLNREGIRLRGGEDDVELLSYLLDASRRDHSLEFLSRERLQVDLPELPVTTGRKARPLKDFAPQEVAVAYAARAEVARRLAPGLWQELEPLGLAKLARELELPLVPLLARMESDGVKVDVKVLREISEKVGADCEAKVKEIHQLAGTEFNVGSNPQLAEVLYKKLNLPVLKRGKTGPSTDQEVLEKLAEVHALPRAIIEYRSLSKLKSTYLDTLPELVAKDGRLHTTFHQAATATGRLSSSDPNLQNIPIRTELGMEIRRAFVAEEGHQLVSADYSQIELRLLAHIAEDPVLIDAFARDEDIHSRTAAEIFGVAQDQVTRDQRRVAKTVNFGIAYGLSPYGLSTRLNIPEEEARDIIERYFTRYAGIKRYLDETVRVAREKGYVETLFGRRRPMGDLSAKNRQVVQAAERAAINMPIQGTAADLIKKAMLAVDAELEKQGLRTRMLLQVHDELLFEAPESEVEAVKELARRCMNAVMQLKVPLKVEVGAGKTWADAH
ncbi:DNA polymerase I [Vitiosangium sp. GDMCC 1.1324]|uniref:DNA polymerase I n=1 Tax=Vitiosangium sp. (strain GDMCC 1.1324) TaxID=2138576 RepID=UPI000D338C53|nr:DNA polymerase I [Vitiosangium sp. GDMCC 1.1324]PTL76314.1 DNA polymerase I [Vitiosangium sp. GDMCC 1.1324]